MKILVCGDRNWSDRDFLNERLDHFRKGIGLSGADISLLIEGEASGADSMARDWAHARGIPVDPHPADWGLYGKSAGPIRNQEMLDVGPQFVIAFHNDIENSRGTKDMVTRARKAGVRVLVEKSGSTP